MVSLIKLSFFISVLFFLLLFISDIGDKEATSMARISGVSLHLFLTIYSSFLLISALSIVPALLLYAISFFSPLVSGLFISGCVVTSFCYHSYPLLGYGSGLKKSLCIYQQVAVE